MKDTSFAIDDDSLITGFVKTEKLDRLLDYSSMKSFRLLNKNRMTQLYYVRQI